MMTHTDLQNLKSFLKDNWWRTTLCLIGIVAVFVAFTRLYHMECSRQTGVCVISQFHLEKMSYQKTETIPLSSINGMIVDYQKRWKSHKRRSGTAFYQLRLLHRNGTSYELEMIETPWFEGNKKAQAQAFNHFIQNTSQTTYTYDESKGFLWVFVMLLLVAGFVCKKIYVSYVVKQDIRQHIQQASKNVNNIRSR